MYEWSRPTECELIVANDDSRVQKNSNTIFHPQWSIPVHLLSVCTVKQFLKILDFKELRTKGALSVSPKLQNFLSSRYNEIKAYDFSKPGFKSGIGHFSQVVWKSTDKIGVGFAESNKNNGHEVIVVARYSPAGNMANTFAENVMPLKWNQDYIIYIQ